jgi:hypothetical protein
MATTSRPSFPSYIYNSYKNITHSSLYTSNDLTEETIKEFQDFLNGAQPTENDLTMFNTFRLLYRSTKDFDRFLIKNRLKHLILWTEAKSIVRHFNLYGLVYVKWNVENHQYECSRHKNFEETLQKISNRST